MNYMTIFPCDATNGPGIRVSLFVSGCPHHCKGCFNPESWPYEAGTHFTSRTLEEIKSLLQRPGRTGFSLLGGEPLCTRNRDQVWWIITSLKKEFPDLNIWVYTGSTYETLRKEGDPQIQEIFNMIDVLVDGPFIEEKKNLMLKFRGSSNQRIIDMKQTRLQNQVMLHELNN